MFVEHAVSFRKINEIESMHFCFRFGGEEFKVRKIVHEIHLSDDIEKIERFKYEKPDNL